jgi:hypothetical protein
MALVSRLASGPLRKRSLFALGAVTFTIGLATRWSLSASPRPAALFRPLSHPFTVSAATGIAALVPPQPALKWDHSPEDVLALTKAAIQRDREVCNAHSLKYGFAHGSYILDSRQNCGLASS